MDNDVERTRLLSAFLTRHRSRSGLTSEEIAAACGINSRWFDLAQRGETTRASASILRALGTVLGLSQQERLTLLDLATPYFDCDTPRDESFEVRDAFVSLRRYINKLRVCSTTDEVLNLVLETAASHFPEASYLTAASRAAAGGWFFHGEPIAKPSRLYAFAHDQNDIVAPIFASEPLLADIMTCFPERSSPGELIAHYDHDETTLAGILGTAYGDFEALHEASMVAVVRSRAGFVAHLYLGEFLKVYDRDVDCALLSAIADFASVAASR